MSTTNHPLRSSNEFSGGNQVGSVWALCSSQASLVTSILWPLMNEKEILNAMKCNTESYALLSKYPVRAVADINIIDAYRHTRPIIQRVKIASLPRLTARMQLLLLTHLTFDDHFNQPLTVGVLPSLLTHLTFGQMFDQQLSLGVLPPLLTHLTFSENSNFDQPLTVGVLPSSLTHLTFGQWFDQPLSAKTFPPALTCLTFSRKSHFNQPLTVGVLPSLLTHLTFGQMFDQQLSLGVLPPLLTHLTFSENSNFDQPLTVGVLPSSLTHLTFGPNSRFSQHSANFVITSRCIATKLTRKHSTL